MALIGGVVAVVLLGIGGGAWFAMRPPAQRPPETLTAAIQPRRTAARDRPGGTARLTRHRVCHPTCGHAGTGRSADGQAYRTAPIATARHRGTGFPSVRRAVGQAGRATAVAAAGRRGTGARTDHSTAGHTRRAAARHPGPSTGTGADRQGGGTDAGAARGAAARGAAARGAAACGAGARPAAAADRLCGHRLAQPGGDPRGAGDPLPVSFLRDPALQPLRRRRGQCRRALSAWAHLRPRCTAHSRRSWAAPNSVG